MGRGILAAQDCGLAAAKRLPGPQPRDDSGNDSPTSSFLPGTMGVAPFDIPEAETEILEGPLLRIWRPAAGALFRLQARSKPL